MRRAMRQVQSSIKLQNGVSIPTIGLGVYQARGDECSNAVKHALDAGYRHFDSALVYRNEALVGQALSAGKVPRSELFFTTKLPPKLRGYDQTVSAIQESLSNCGLDHIDLYLIHAPYGTPQERLGQWRAIEEAIDAGKIRAGGVSNYNTWHIQELLDSKPKHRPQINQIELHPWLQRAELVDFCRKNDIAPEAYSPLTRGQKVDDPTLAKIAAGVGKTPGQVLLRWSLQKGFITLPKSVTPSRIVENLDVFSWELDQDAMAALDALECGLVTGWDPTTSPL